jgi:hypothetical protein
MKTPPPEPQQQLLPAACAILAGRTVAPSISSRAKIWGNGHACEHKFLRSRGVLSASPVQLDSWLNKPERYCDAQTGYTCALIRRIFRNVAGVGDFIQQHVIAKTQSECGYVLNAPDVAGPLLQDVFTPLASLASSLGHVCVILAAFGPGWLALDTMEIQFDGESARIGDEHLK